MKYLIIIGIVFLLAGCSDDRMPDQCMREKVFKECMAAVPAEVDMSQWNSYDVNRVIDKCTSFAYYASMREPQYISKNCK